MPDLYKFCFQKEHRELGCEDAPPVCENTHLIVCDGLGGSGKDKISIEEDGKGRIRTSAYIGSRILASYTDRIIRENYDSLVSEVFSREDPESEDFTPFVFKWYRGLDDAYKGVRVKLGIEAPKEGERMLFPSTLASVIICPHGDRVRMLVMWAGDSRVYWLSPEGGLQQLSMDDSADPFDSLHSTSHMRNCLAHQKGRNHHINYAYHEVSGKGLLFACSDGVTDYLPSPMTLERVMLVLGSRAKECAEGRAFPEVFSDSVKNVLFRTIYDDTTLSGVFVGIRTAEDFMDSFRERSSSMMDSFETADEIITEEVKEPGKILGIFKRKQILPEEDPRFERIWNAYEGGYQKFRTLDIRKIWEDEL